MMLNFLYQNFDITIINIINTYIIIILFINHN